MPPEQQNSPEGQQAESHPSYQLTKQIDQAAVLQLITESQQVLQQMLASEAVWDELAVFYPKAFQALSNLIAAFESLSVMLQEVGALHDVQEQEPDEAKEPSPSKKKPSPKTDENKSKRKKAVVGDTRQVMIGGRSYTRRYEADGKWHYVSSGQHGGAKAGGQ